MNSSGESAATSLPVPPDEALALSDRLLGRIVAEIEQQGAVIGFDEYMHMALYEPGLGYYSAGSPKFGASGDFVTAPEISSLFGQCLARQAGDLIEQGCAPAILEFGAGSGKLCAQILEAMPELQRYLVLDLSADLRQRQQQYLRAQLPARLFDKIEWLDRLPQDFDGIVLANEVLDAMPVKLLHKQSRWVELGVGWQDDALVWQPFEAHREALDAICKVEQAVGELPDDYCTEVNLNYQPWFTALADACRRAVVLIIDYGYEQAQYYHVERRRGTLTCHYRHRVHNNPFLYPGLQDITAFVDFDACADAAEQSGFAISGLIDQGRFLLANGLLEQAQLVADAGDAVAQLAISQQVATLTLPQEMGEKFKVLALQKNIDPEMPALRRERAYG